MNYEINKMLTLSTAHITKETDNLLRLECNGTLLIGDALSDIVVYEKGEYGYFVFISEEFEADCNEFPKDLAACIKLAVSLNCAWLCLDRDGGIVENLKTFDW